MAPKRDWCKTVYAKACNPTKEGTGCDTGRHACRVSDLDAALDIASRVLPAYERLLDLPYPLPKLDLVAIPDFAAGAHTCWCPEKSTFPGHRGWSRACKDSPSWQ